MKDQTKHWVELAEYDLETAEAMFRTKRYVYVVFMCHLCIEKMLKGCVVEFADRFPPKTHSLVRLAEIAGIEFPEKLRKFVTYLSDKSVVTRYPEDLKDFTRAVARSCLKNTREAFKWLRRKLK
jgi:HEPN domain-containing protein